MLIIHHSNIRAKTVHDKVNEEINISNKTYFPSKFLIFYPLTANALSGLTLVQTTHPPASAPTTQCWTPDLIQIANIRVEHLILQIAPLLYLLVDGKTSEDVVTNFILLQLTNYLEVIVYIVTYQNGSLYISNHCVNILTHLKIWGKPYLCPASTHDFWVTNSRFLGNKCKWAKMSMISRNNGTNFLPIQFLQNTKF